MTSLWGTSPKQAFAQFIRTKAFIETGRSRSSDWLLSENSVKSYCFMFGKFIDWIESKNYDFMHLDETQIELFLSELKTTAKSEIRWRYIRLIERVFLHLNDLKFISHNPVPSLAKRQTIESGRRSIRGSDQLTESISREDLKTTKVKLKLMSFSSKWKDRRDSALASLLCCAGLRLSEALSLSIHDIYQNNNEYVITIKKTTSLSFPRIIHCANFDSELLDIIVRWKTSCDSDLHLFYGTSAKNTAMDSATAYRRIKKILGSFEFDIKHKSGRTLRNSFVKGMLEEGVSVEKVQSILGIRESHSLNRYQKT